MTQSRRRRRVAILGSTGSIGTQALDLIAQHPDRFEVVALAAGRNIELLREQSRRFGAEILATARDGASGLRRVATASDADVVLAATVGSVAFGAVFAAVERGIDIAIANKELIVAAGELLTETAAAHGAQILPVDSEHSAIFQCLAGEDRASVEAIVLTASGGPFWRRSRAEMDGADLRSALAHPTWRMGTKNTIDSATMMNKGLEVIEASRLFALPGNRIKIVVHPQSIAHGFVIFRDGSVKSQLAAPDMRLPIGYALSYPERLPDHGNGRSDVLAALGGGASDGALHYEFERPDPERFPCIPLAYEALARGGTLPAVLSAANEIAVDAFVHGRVAFGKISEVVRGAMDRAEAVELSLETIELADRKAREAAGEIVRAIEIRSGNHSTC
ncbi:MAG: 1-deoxy-D-xylulose-5-phosphate reductoisomerase [Candidatus Eremiobacteraeota bacterium]|nr:1-deoxy-D-xylulose-5-phosphate reductoisomerase [Candidatus Eremiobacteraeota bacterium]